MLSIQDLCKDATNRFRLIGNHDEPTCVFAFDAAKFSGLLSSKGYVLVKKGLDRSFFAFAYQQACMLLTSDAQSMEAYAVPGKKTQFLFQFPANPSVFNQLLSVVGEMFGVSASSLRVSERHIKAYSATAPANPVAHKDRMASQVAVGIPLWVNEMSRLFLYPTTLRSPNMLDCAAELRANQGEEQHSELLLGKIPRIYVDAQPGDVVLFLGSEIYHERENAAETVVLYFKLNCFGFDPLGEDPRTAQERDCSLAIVSSFTDEQLMRCNVTLSPRLRALSTTRHRRDWNSVYHADIGGDSEIALDHAEAQSLVQIKTSIAVKSLCVMLYEISPAAPVPLARIRRLGELGVVDIHL